MVHNMKELIKSPDGINKEITQSNLSTDVHERTIVPRRKESSFVCTSNVIGRSKEKESIIEWLRSRRSDDATVGIIEVLPIIGMAGIGKTTLAQLVFDDESVKGHFKHKIWLSMPLEFEIKKIMRDILKCLGSKAKFGNWSRKKLQNRLRKRVKGRRCLFVMDDVWTMRREDWVILTKLLRGLSKGSKVIVTSRDQTIAKVMGTVPSLNLANLSLKDSLTLFVRHAFKQGREKNHSELMEIGEEIVRKCGGNPMAVRALGCLVYSKYKQSYWKNVRDSEMWKLQTDILPSLRKSYDQMPSYLEKCFTYCSIFPKNQKFNSFDLIQLWISNGFIQRNKNSQEELEEIGWRYLEELLSISFFTIVDDPYSFLHFRFPFLHFEMHNLIYELAISVAQTEFSNIKEWTQDISPTTRHLSFPNHHDVPKDEPSGCLSKLSHVDTIVCKGLGSRDFLKTCISQSKHLRVLWLEDSSFDLLPRSIGGLKHLRCLGLQNNSDIKKLPKSVCKLRKLQTLDLGGCNELKKLPTNINNMISLRALTITTKQQRFPKGGIGCLTSLRCLWIGKCENLEALFDDIQSLTSLRQLIIHDCPKLASLPQGIKNLKALKHLLITTCKSLRLPEGDSNESCSTSRLQLLTLVGLPKLVSLPGWLEGSASTLQNIIVVHCPKLSVLPKWLQNCSSLRTLMTEAKEPFLLDGFRFYPCYQS